MPVYNAFIFKQVAKSPIQLAFVATSAEVDRWAKVPTKLARKPTAFQRPHIQGHVTEVKEFFADASHTNASPTALIVGCEPESQNRVKILRSDSDAPFPLDDVGLEAKPCRVKIDFEPWSSATYHGDLDREIDDLYAQVRSLYEGPAPMPAAPASTDIAQTQEDEDDEGEIEVDEEDDEEDDEESNDAPDVDSATDEGAIDATLLPEGAAAPIAKRDEIAEHREYFNKASAAQIAHACASHEFVGWPQKKKELLRDLLRDDRKIGLVIDGQHRMKGTAETGEFPFIISFLPYATWAELAFQFIVNNGSAKKVSEGLLISIVGESLSGEELKSIETRLYKARIKVSLIKAVMRVHEGDNPFRGMLRFRVPGEKGFLDAPAMEKKVVLLWHGDRDKNGRGRLTKVKLKERNPLSMKNLFIENCDGATLQEKIDDWQRDKWFKYFSAFWSAVSENYQPRLWPATNATWPPSSGVPGSASDKERLRLLSVTMLGILQTAVLAAWQTDETKALRKKKSANQKKDLHLPKTTPEDFKQKIAELIQMIPQDFFIELKASGFDGSDTLRSDLRKQMLFLLENHKEFPDIKSTHAFWKQPG